MGNFRLKLSEGLRLTLMAAVGVVCAAGGAGAQAPSAPTTKIATTTLVEPPTQLLPQHFGDWQQVKSDTDGSVAASDATAQAVLKEDGMLRFGSSSYKRDGSGETVEMKAYQFGDVTGAVAFYTYLRSANDRPAAQLELGPDASLNANGRGLLFRQDATVIATDYNAGLRAADLTALEVALPKAVGATALAPLLPTLLPEKGLDAESVKYVLGPAGYQAMGGAAPAGVVGFDKSAEAVTARYRGGGALTLLLYPTPTIAGDAARAVAAAMPANAGTVKLRREGPLVALTTGPWSAKVAQAMVDGVHLHAEVSFDQPLPLEFHAEVQKTYSLLENIVIFCAISAVAMVVLGLFFGGGRALIRVMQGKPAASEPEFLRIDLSDRGERRSHRHHAEREL